MIWILQEDRILLLVWMDNMDWRIGDERWRTGKSTIATADSVSALHLLLYWLFSDDFSLSELLSFFYFLRTWTQRIQQLCEYCRETNHTFIGEKWFRNQIIEIKFEYLLSKIKQLVYAFWSLTVSGVNFLFSKKQVANSNHAISQ